MGLAPVKIRIKRLISKIITSNYMVTTPGMPHYFTQEMGKHFLASQENKHQVIIQPESPSQRNDALAKNGDEPAPTSKELLNVTHPSGVVIKVIVGDITSHQVDAIVNAANGHLSHLGGLAKAIVDKGEFSILMFYRKYFRK